MHHLPSLPVSHFAMTVCVSIAEQKLKKAIEAASAMSKDAKDALSLGAVAKNGSGRPKRLKKKKKSKDEPAGEASKSKQVRVKAEAGADGVADAGGKKRRRSAAVSETVQGATQAKATPVSPIRRMDFSRPRSQPRVMRPSF